MKGVVRQKKVRNRSGDIVSVPVYFFDLGGITGEVEVSEKEYKKVFPDKPLDFSNQLNVAMDWKQPVESVGLAVVPKRIKEAEAFCEKHGVPTDFSTHRGAPIIKSRAHQKKVLKIFRKHNNQD